MAHDFAKRAQQHKRNLATVKKKSSLSKGLLLLTLLLVVGFAAFLYHLAKIQPQPSLQSSKSVPINNADKVKTTAPAKTQSPKNKYDFYTLLPESEVIAPKVEAYHSEPKGSNDENYAYMLQAGSFQNSADADRLRAQLILLGLDAQSNLANTSNGRWYRVVVGPFSSRSELNLAQDILARANTESMLIKIKR